MNSFFYIIRELAIGGATMLVLISILISTFGFGLSTKNAQAFDGGGSLMLVTKEFTLDALAWRIVDMTIQRISRQTIQWINSGFRGQPAFMQNFGNFMTNTADDAVGSYLQQTSPLFNFLCSPFRADIRAALSIQYAKSRNFGTTQCNVSGAFGNIENFFNMNTMSGGWNQWFKVTQDPQYNPYGALLIGEQQLNARLTNAKGQEVQLLGWGKGFMSRTECDEPSPGNVQCRTVTPGSTIENSLNEALALPGRRVSIADEINEMLAALFTQLTSQALGGAGGLLGLTRSSGSGASYRPSFYETLQSDPTNNRNPIEVGIVNETRYRDLQQSIVNDINTAEAYYATNYSGSSVPSCSPIALPQSLVGERAAADVNYALSNSTLITLNDLNRRYQAAQGQPNEAEIREALVQEYLDLLSNETAHGEIHNRVVTEVDIPRINDLISDYTGELDTQCQDRSQ